MQVKIRVPDEVWEVFCASLPDDITPSDRVRELIQSPLTHIMGTKEASDIWGFSQDHVKRLCRDGKVKAVQIGETWILDKNQPNPKKETPTD